MKKPYRFILCICGLAVIAFICYHSIGWAYGDMSEYIKENYKPDGQEIISVEFLHGGQDAEGGYKIYRVSTESGSVHYIRLNVVYHRHLTQIGPDFKILGITEFSGATHIMQGK